MTPEQVWNVVMRVNEDDGIACIADAIRAAEQEAEAREREACAQIADNLLNVSHIGGVRNGCAREIAALIRKRGQP